MSTLRKAVLIGFYGVGNLGDELMLFTITQWLRHQGIETTVIGEGADAITRDHGLPAESNIPIIPVWSIKDSWFRGRAWQLIQIFRRHDIVIVGGGDLLRDDNGWKQFVYTLEKLILGIVLGKPTFMVNVGIGRPDTSYGRFGLRTILPRLRSIIVRDSRSVAVCQKAGAAENVQKACDIVNDITEFLDPVQFEQHRLACTSNQRSYMLVCLRANSDVYGRYRLDDGRLHRLALALDRLAREADLDIRFLPFQSSPQESDDSIHQRVMASMLEKHRASSLPWSGDPERAAAQFSGARFVLAMRLHAAVLATGFRKPVTLMPYDHKVVQFAEQHHLSSLLLPETLDSEDDTFAALDDSLQAGYSGSMDEDLLNWRQLSLFDDADSGC